MSYALYRPIRPMAMQSALYVLTIVKYQPLHMGTAQAFTSAAGELLPRALAEHCCLATVLAHAQKSRPVGLLR